MAYGTYGNNNGYNKGGYNNGGYNKSGYNNQNGGYNKQQGGNNSGKNNKVGAIWKGITKTGSEYLTITIGDKKYVAFINGYKNSPNQPDYNIMESTSGQNGAQSSKTGGYNNGGQNSGYNNQQCGGYKPAGNGGYGAAQNSYGKPNQAAEQNNVDDYYNSFDQSQNGKAYEEVEDIADLPAQSGMPLL